MTASSGRSLYFIALLPNPVVQDEVTRFKETARDRFGSGHALKSPPHITLIPPFGSNQTDFSALQTFAQAQEPFAVQLRHFNRFGSRVIFVDVLPEPPLLACQAQLATFCHGRFGIKPDTRPFHPHMTVAFRDLQRAVFPAAWAYFSTQSYERTFTAEGVTILRHTGQRWVVEETFALGRLFLPPTP